MRRKQDATVPGEEHSKPILLKGEHAGPVYLGCREKQAVHGLGWWSGFSLGAYGSRGACQAEERREI